MESQAQIVLGVDPGTRFLGLAVLRGQNLQHYAVRTLRNGRRPYNLLGDTRGHVLAAIRDFKPNLVAIEEPLLLPTKRAALVSAVAQELHERVRELGITVVELAPERIRALVAQNPKATKIELAHALVSYGFKELQPLVPKRPARAVLGATDRDRYWLHALDATSVALAATLGWRGSG